MITFTQFLEDMDGGGTDLGSGGASGGVHRSTDIVATLHVTHHGKHGKKTHHVIAKRTAGGHWIGGGYGGGYLTGSFAHSCEGALQGHNDDCPSGDGDGDGDGGGGGDGGDGGGGGGGGGA